MPLIYKPIKSNLPNKEGKKLYYPRLVKMGKIVDTQKLAEIIAEKSTLTPGDVHNTVRNLMSVMREQLLNSKTVRLDGIGTFTMIARANGKGVENAENVTSTQITRLICRFTPEYTRPAGSTTTRALMDGVEYVNIKELAGRSLIVDLDFQTTGVWIDGTFYSFEAKNEVDSVVPATPGLVFSFDGDGLAMADITRVRLISGDFQTITTLNSNQYTVEHLSDSELTLTLSGTIPAGLVVHDIRFNNGVIVAILNSVGGGEDEGEIIDPDA